MPRLFTGLEIPPALAQELALLRGGLSGARWIEASDYHITLRFIGDIDGATARDIAATLADIRKRPFTVTLDGLGVFGGDRPRAIVVKARPDQPLVELQSKHESTLRRLGLAAEPRKFTPHVTLARLKSASQMGVADYLSARGWFLSRAFEAKRFVLFSARDSVGGGPYVVEAAYPLG